VPTITSPPARSARPVDAAGCMRWSLVCLRFRGQPLVAVRRYERERLRCSACGALFVAHLPPGASPERDDTSLKAILAVAHSHLGLPFDRLEALQQLLGLPWWPAATQWEQVADLGYVVFNHLLGFATQRAVVFQDDTGARVVALSKANQAAPPPERQAISTTALRGEGEQTVCLFFTGRQHAGENLDDLLALRDATRPPLLWMSDALAANTPKCYPEWVVDLNCLIHARRQFVAIQAFFPGHCAHVLTAIATVYHHEAQCTEAGLNPAPRLASHQAHSAPVMDALKGWMEQQLDDKHVEPNSRRGQAFNDMRKRWAALRGFLRIPGAPLDNNFAEQVLKLSGRYRNNSLFYKNPHGAYVGDVLRSLIEICRRNSVNPIDDLSALRQQPLRRLCRSRRLVAVALPSRTRSPSASAAGVAVRPLAASHRPCRRPRGCHSITGSAARAPSAAGLPVPTSATRSAAPGRNVSGTARSLARRSKGASTPSHGGGGRRRSPR
jgi:transposase